MSLARCAYRRADLYVLDDPLSAVDAEVGRHIYQECLSMGGGGRRKGLLRRRAAAVLMAAHQVWERIVLTLPLIATWYKQF